LKHNTTRRKLRACGRFPPKFSGPSIEVWLAPMMGERAGTPATHKTNNAPPCTHTPSARGKILRRSARSIDSAERRSHIQSQSSDTERARCAPYCALFYVGRLHLRCCTVVTRYSDTRDASPLGQCLPAHHLQALSALHGFPNTTDATCIDQLLGECAVGVGEDN
jgi:hypothetical protein